MRIEECLQYVLLEQEYVSLPGVGSFIRTRSEAYVDDQHTIHPVTYTLSFSEERNFDDGALLNYLIVHSTLHEEELRTIYSLWIEVLKENLAQGLVIHFQGIGELQKRENRINLVTSDETVLLTHRNTPAYVLPKSKGIKRRRNRRVSFLTSLLIGLSLASASIVLTYLFLKPQSKEQKEIATHKEEKTKTDSTTLDFSLALPQDSSLLKEETKQILDSSHKQVNALRVVAKKTQRKFCYYIVAGSFSSIENANKLKHTLEKKGYRAEVSKLTGMYRVTLGKFYDKKTGVREMNKRREELKDESYWLIEITEHDIKEQ